MYQLNITQLRKPDLTAVKQLTLNVLDLTEPLTPDEVRTAVLQEHKKQALLAEISGSDSINGRSLITEQRNKRALRQLCKSGHAAKSTGKPAGFRLTADGKLFCDDRKELPIVRKGKEVVYADGSVRNVVTGDVTPPAATTSKPSKKKPTRKKVTVPSKRPKPSQPTAPLDDAKKQQINEQLKKYGADDYTIA